jgi:hypothetical protein
MWIRAIGCIALAMAVATRAEAAVAHVTRRELLDTLFTGVGATANVAGRGNGVVVVADGVIVMLDSAEAAVDSFDSVQRFHLLVIAHDRETLHRLESEGRLKRGDREFDIVRAELQNDVRTMSVPSSEAFFIRAATSPVGFTAAARNVFQHYLISFLGERFAEVLGAGTATRSLMLEEMASGRDMPRAVWEQGDRISRLMAKSLDEIASISAETAITKTVERSAEALERQSIEIAMPLEHIEIARPLEPVRRAMVIARPVAARAQPVPARAQPLLQRAAETSDTDPARAQQPASSEPQRQTAHPNDEGRAMRQLKEIERTGNWPPL